MSTSQRVVRALIIVTSVGLALMMTLTAPRASVTAALVIVILTTFVAFDPASRLTTILLLLHGLAWMFGTDVPSSWREWLGVLGVATALLVIHLAASLAAALPPAAPLPRSTVRRWSVRTLAVLALSAPVWVVLVAQTGASPAGDPALTYAAVAAIALLGTAFWWASTTRSAPR